MSEAKINGDAAVIDKLANGFADEAPIGEPKPPQPGPRYAQNEALRLFEAGFRVVPLHPINNRRGDEYEDGKRPVGNGWGEGRRNWNGVVDKLNRYPRAGIGIQLGPGCAPGGKWLVDVEIDGPEGTESLIRFLGGEVVETRGWSSARGGHHLFVVPNNIVKLLEGAGAIEGTGLKSGTYHLFEYPGLEIRTGGWKEEKVRKQVQSACPPTWGGDKPPKGEPVANPTPREWNGVETVAELPPAAVAVLKDLAKGRPEPQAEAPAEKPNGKAKHGSFTLKDISGNPVTAHAVKALGNELATLATTPEGGRNNQLFKTTAALCELINAGSLDGPATIEAIREAARSAGLGDAETEATIRSAQRATAGKARDLSHVGNGKAGGTRAKAKAAPGVDQADADALRDDRQEIVIETNELRVRNKTVAALAKDQGLYQSEGVLANVIEDHRGARIFPLPEPTIRATISAAAKFIRWMGKDRDGNDQWKVVPVPDTCVKAVAALTPYPEFIRRIDGVIEAPTIRPDGSVLDQPGYDPATRLFYKPNADYPPVPKNPTQEDVKQALAELRDIVHDFPWRGKDDEAVWLAAVKTTVCRAAFEGQAPGFGFDGNAPGVGKGLLASTVSIIATGEEVTPDPLPSGMGASEELRKFLVAIAMEKRRIVSFDDIDGPLDSNALRSAITEGRISGRIMGKSQTIKPELKPTWLFTGNNIVLKGDMNRRVFLARLETDLENPEERTGFKHPNLIARCKAVRGRLVVAALTIVRAYILAGKPEQPIVAAGSFEDWRRVIASAVYWCGAGNPLAVRQFTKANNPDENLREAIVAGWAELHRSEVGVTVFEAIKQLNAPGNEDKLTTLRAALMEMSRNNDLPSTGSISKRLQKIKDRVFGRLVLRYRLDNATKTGLWSVEKVAPPPKSRGGADQSPEMPETPEMKYGASPATQTRKPIRFPSNSGDTGDGLVPHAKNTNGTTSVAGASVGNTLPQESPETSPVSPASPGLDGLPHVAAFIADRVEVGPDHSEAKASLHDAWLQWCAENGREPGKATPFFGAMRGVLLSGGAEVDEHRGVVSGLRLRPLETEDDPNGPCRFAMPSYGPNDPKPF